MIFDILSLMLGSKYCMITEKIEQYVFGEFNSMCVGKILFGFDEMNIKVSKDLDGKIKDFITGKDFFINCKGKDAFKSFNCNTTFAFTNGDMPLNISKDDRRITGVDSSHKEIPPTEYFQRLLEIMKNKKAIRILFNYFMKIDISNFNPKTDRPKSEFIEDIKELSRPLEVSFFIDYFKENKIEKIFAYELFSEFQSWLHKFFNNDVKYNTSIIGFGQKIKNLHIDGFSKKDVKDKNDCKTKLCYFFEFESIHLWMIKNKYIVNQERLLK